MSFIYSQALVEEFLQGRCSDTEQSAPLNGNPTLRLCLWHDKTTELSRLSRFGMTCRPLMERAGEVLLTSWLEDFHAKTSQQQEKVQESMESAAECGNTWRGWLAKFDPDSCSWKTAQCSFLEDSTECLETLPRSGMTRDGLLWELPMLERRTSETDSGFWPTPTVNGNYNKKGLSPTSGDGLATAVMKRMWPTPTMQGLNGGSNSRSAAMKRGYWPTPQASDNRNRGTKETPAIARRMEAGKQVMLSMCMDGPLNPNWVEWLMGWPIGHTALKPLETDKSPNVQQQPSSFCLEVSE